MSQITELIIILYFLFIMGIFLLCMFFHCYRNANITTIKENERLKNICKKITRIKTNSVSPIQETKENQLKIETLTTDSNV